MICEYVAKCKKKLDLINVEFARNIGKDKFFADHRKLLREAKTSVDQLYASQFLTNHNKRSIQGHCIQVFGVEGQINEVKLVDNGLYISRTLGSLRLPTSEADLYKARVILERLMCMKKMALSNRNHHIELENNKVINSKSMNQ